MKLYIPSISDLIVLTNSWKFVLHPDYRNSGLYEIIAGKPYSNYWSPTESVNITLLPDTILSIDRIYIRKGKKDYDSVSFIIKKASFLHKQKPRFWAKLEDVNNIEFEIVEKID